VRATRGAVRILVNNVAINWPGSVCDYAVERWRRTVVVRVTGPWCRCRTDGAWCAWADTGSESTRSRWGFVLGCGSSISTLNLGNCACQCPARPSSPGDRGRGGCLPGFGSGSHDHRRHHLRQRRLRRAEVSLRGLTVRQSTCVAPWGTARPPNWIRRPRAGGRRCANPMACGPSGRRIVPKSATRRL
jgi:hypothetical protein